MDQSKRGYEAICEALGFRTRNDAIDARLELPSALDMAIVITYTYHKREKVTITYKRGQNHSQDYFMTT
ncbi:unnamed protein product [Diabrotica balteata]|uniref:Uncharacterized protein n=1 Tax=Diabrotica balteata TaxID=107213 RepID=A0A9N9T5Y9_DIABA|nr:unnamed protein product [Diabrotica balteata]